MTTRLLQILRKRSTHRRIVLARAPSLQEELRCSFEELQRSLTELARTGAVEILTPLPYLVVALSAQPWPGMTANTAKTPNKSGPSVNRAYSFQSSLSQSKQLIKESYRQPVDDETLMREILETLGETDPTTFRGAIKSYPAGVIRTTLDRIRRMKSVRKNRTALFRYLLPRIAKEFPSTN